MTYLSYGLCVSDMTKVKKECDKATKEKSKDCRDVVKNNETLTAAEKRDARRECRNTYRQEMKECKDSFKASKEECEQYR